MNTLFGPIIIFLSALTPVLGLALAVFIDRWRRKRIEQAPQQEKLLRPPGHSLALRLEQTIDSAIESIVVACASSGCAGVFGVLFIQFSRSHVSAAWLFISSAPAASLAATGIFMAIRAFQLLQKARNIRLGLRGEQAVAEVLNEVADCGFRAFHDFPGGEDWNIDHIVAGTRGVFLIETKARRRRGSRNGQPAHEVIYNGESLQFPMSKETKPIEQARMNAKWLSNFLEKKTGEPVRVEPVVILPGWFVTLSEKGNFPVKVMNASYVQKFLRRQSEFIESRQVRRIIAALDEKCRDVEF
jgi:nuclease-like protein